MENVRTLRGNLDRNDTPNEFRDLWKSLKNRFTRQYWITRDQSFSLSRRKHRYCSKQKSSWKTIRHRSQQLCITNTLLQRISLGTLKILVYKIQLTQKFKSFELFEKNTTRLTDFSKTQSGQTFYEESHFQWWSTFSFERIREQLQFSYLSHRKSLRSSRNSNVFERDCSVWVSS